jgi:hypothetical protein
MKLRAFSNSAPRNGFQIYSLTAESSEKGAHGIHCIGGGWVPQLAWTELQREKREVAASQSWPEWGCKERHRRWLGPRAGLNGVAKRETGSGWVPELA